jgi:hypothetical protein
MEKDQHHESGENISQTGADNKFGKYKFLWEEYKYRHELCWKLIIQITIAVVIILIIPYTKTDIAKSLGNWIVTLPIVAIILLIFSYARLSRELDILHKIRTTYRELQTLLYGIKYCRKNDTFSYHVKLYLIGLIFISIVDANAIIVIWLPKLTLQ